MDLVTTQQMIVSKWILRKQFLNVQDSIDFRLYVVWNLKMRKTTWVIINSTAPTISSLSALYQQW